MKTFFGILFVGLVLISAFWGNYLITENKRLYAELQHSEKQVVEKQNMILALQSLVATLVKTNEKHAELQKPTAATPPQREVIKGKTFEMHFAVEANIMNVFLDLPLEEMTLEVYERKKSPFLRGSKTATERFQKIAAKLLEISPDISGVSFMNGIIVIERLYTTEWNVLIGPIKSVLEAEFPEKHSEASPLALFPLSTR